MNFPEMSDEEVVDKYRSLRKKTKHDKRGRGMACCEELQVNKKRCLALKDEMQRRNLSLNDDCEDSVDTDAEEDSAWQPTIIEGGYRPEVNVDENQTCSAVG